MQNLLNAIFKIICKLIFSIKDINGNNELQNTLYLNITNNNPKVPGSVTDHRPNLICMKTEVNRGPVWSAQ